MSIVRSAVISGVHIRQLSSSLPQIVTCMATTPTQLVYVHGVKSVTIINFDDSWCDRGSRESGDPVFEAARARSAPAVPVKIIW